MFDRRTGILLMAALVVGMAGCGRGGSLGSAVPGGAGTSTALPSGTARATLTLTIPNVASLAASKRQLAYVSSASATVNLTANNGAQTIPNVGLNVSSGSPYCVAAGTGRTCSLPIKAPIGPSVQFTLQILDASSNVLSTSNFATPVTEAIAEGGANALPPVVLDGVPSSFGVTVGAVPYNVQGGALSAAPQVIVTVKDAAGDVIAGPGNYRTSNGLTAITYSIAQFAPTSLTGVEFSSSATCGSPTASATWSAPLTTLYFCNGGSPDIGTQIVVTESDNNVAETIPVPFAAIPISETQLSHNDYVQSPVYFIGTITFITTQYHTDKVGGIGSLAYAFATDADGSQGVGCTLSGGQTPAQSVVYGTNANLYLVGAGSTPYVYEFPESLMTSGAGGACSGTTSAAALTAAPSAPMVEDPLNHRLWAAVGTSIEVVSETGSLPVITTVSSTIGNVNALAYSAPEGAMYASNYGTSKVERISTSSYTTSTITLDGGTGGDVVAAGPDGAVYAMTVPGTTTAIYRLNPGYVFSASPPMIAQYDFVLPDPLFPNEIAVGGDGQIYVAEGLTENIDRIDPVTGNIQTSAAPNPGNLGSIATASGNGINRLLWLNSDFNVYAWPGVFPGN
jgi:hypothetical protein